MHNLAAPLRLLLLLAVFALFATAGVGVADAQTPDLDYPGLYDPFILQTYNLEMTEANWDTILHDTTFDVEVPTLFWADEDPAGSEVLVSVRRKSADSFPLSDPDNPVKVSLKIDINEYTDQYENESGEIQDFCTEDGGFVDPVCTEYWHGVKKLSLENGDDNNVVTEGLAWYLHRLAMESDLDYTTGLAGWNKLSVTITDRVDEEGNQLDDLTFDNGVFMSVEQRDETFLANHDLWEGGDDTWLIKYSDPYEEDYKEAPEDENGDPLLSPAWEALNYQPFQECGKRSGCIDQPNAAAFIADLEEYINMEGMLTFGAVSALHVSPDDLFSKGKNFYVVDYGLGGGSVPLRQREYIEWDLDAAFSGMDVSADIYGVGERKFGDYEDWIINNDDLDGYFKDQYSDIMAELVSGDTPVFDATSLQSDISDVESVLGDALADDPYNALGDSVSGYFASLRTYIADRIENVDGQLPAAPPEPPPGAPEGNVFVADLDGYSTKVSKNGDWEATVTITVHDGDGGDGTPLDGAAVTGVWSHGGELTCDTGADGTCAVVSDIVNKKTGSMTFDVTDVSYTDRSYDAQYDVENTIAIAK